MPHHPSTIQELVQLPLSDIILLAVNDLIAAKDSGHIIDMQTWGKREGTTDQKRSRRRCIACFAGHCLLNYTDDVDCFVEKSVHASMVGQALNHIRNGDILEGAEELYKHISDSKRLALKYIASTAKGYSSDIATDEKVYT